jgi:acetyl-CoA carboxylase, biotin carboxylase subunit
MPSARPIRRVLVANRGEIAVRVMRTLRELGIESVAVFSDVDRRAAHVMMADRAVAIGPAPAAQSYLDIERILDACRASGADAVHPGYGFLSENAEFAAACARAGVAFIGPPPGAMRLMGSKTQARAAVTAAGLPVVPGDSGPDGAGFPDAERAARAAQAIGFPVLIKASAGGGGKGMRLVPDPAGFASAFEGARREAQAAFGDGTVYLERAVVRPRHVEIQVFADGRGNAIHLGERDCSIQRRHQKVIEEAPSPAVSAALRERMGQAAVRAALACDYVGAGTVEFLLASDGAFYFLEMNTRLQVEHPVTEMIHGVDLVAWQIAVARGEPLPFTQAEIDARRHGAAVECRVYAEDPERFLPSPGTISHLRVPGGPFVRDDSGVYEGWTVPVHYDPLLSKLITWGDDRAQALHRMRRALDEYVVRGIRTNLAFHRRMLRHERFLAGDYDTGFIERERAALQPAPDLTTDGGGAAALGVELELALSAAAIDWTERGGNGHAATSATRGASETKTGGSAWRWSTGRGWRR